MKEIKLTQGKFALVDDEDYKWLNQWKWYASKTKNGFYAKRDVWMNDNKSLFMHRELLGLKYKDGFIIDHKDRNTLNNQRNNLRVASYSLNNYNCKMKSHNKSGYRGVGWYKAYNKWRVRITKDGNEISLGYFDDIILAAKAYDAAAIKLYKENAILNSEE